MENATFYPRLCGGIFLSLIEAAKKPNAVVRKQFGSKGSASTLPEVLADLTLVAKPTSVIPSKENLAPHVSRYRKCEISSSSHFPFDEASFIDTFEDRMNSRYDELLANMQAFVYKHIDVNNDTTRHNLVAGLLETIMMDPTIVDTEPFIVENAKKISKADFCNLDEYELSHFLLAVWFYIIHKKIDNTVGKDTFYTWHTQKSDRSPWKYNGLAGKRVIRSFKVLAVAPDTSSISHSANDSADLEHFSERESVDSFTDDIDRINSLWASVKGVRLEPIKKEDDIAEKEFGYVYPLYDAYAQKLHRPVKCKSDLTRAYQDDLEMRREHFFAAETVRLQGEQALGSIVRAEFDDLKGDILSGVWNTYMDDYPDGYTKMRQVMSEASKAICTKGNLIKTGWIGSGEKQGIGHMLAADKRLIWAVDEDE